MPKLKFLKSNLGEEEVAVLKEMLPSGLENTKLLYTSNPFNVDTVEGDFQSILNLGLVNNIRQINKFFIRVNDKLEVGQYYLGRYESIRNRYARKRVRLNPLIFGITFLFS